VQSYNILIMPTQFINYFIVYFSFIIGHRNNFPSNSGKNCICFQFTFTVFVNTCSNIITQYNKLFDPILIDNISQRTDIRSIESLQRDV
jgi:hypothetical protein